MGRKVLHHYLLFCLFGGWRCFVVLLLPGPGHLPWWGELRWRREGALLLCCPQWLGWSRRQRGPASLHAHRHWPPGLPSRGPQCQPRGQLCVTRHVCVRVHKKKKAPSPLPCVSECRCVDVCACGSSWSVEWNFLQAQMRKKQLLQMWTFYSWLWMNFKSLLQTQECCCCSLFCYMTRSSFSFFFSLYAPMNQTASGIKHWFKYLMMWM